jgi:hypothetical protein
MTNGSAPPARSGGKSGLDKRVSSHFDQAAHNEKLVDHFVNDILPRNPEFADWTITVMFYAAVHYTKGALLRDHGLLAYTHRSHRDEHGAVHEGHNELVRQYLGVDVSIAYRELFDRSQEARYRPYRRKFGTVNEALNAINLLRVHLATIRDACT